MDLLHQLARDNKVQLEERPKDPVETCGENPEKEDIVGMQEDIPDTQGGDPLRARDQEKRSQGIKIARWELSFHLMRSCLENQEN